MSAQVINRIFKNWKNEKEKNMPKIVHVLQYVNEKHLQDSNVYNSNGF
jgi:hypothetical protein